MLLLALLVAGPAATFPALVGCAPDDGSAGDDGGAGDGGAGDGGAGDGGSGDGGDGGSPVTDDRLSLEAVQPCDAPATRPTWTEQGEAWGLTGPPDPDIVRGNGGGLAVHDLDLDGDLDVVMSDGERTVQLFRRDGDAFQREAFTRGNAGLLSVADLDGDGWPEILAGGERPQLLRNDKGLFTTSSLSADLPIEDARELAPADLDGDGDLDLVVAAVTSDVDRSVARDLVLWNDGKLQFRADPTAFEADAATAEPFDLLVWDWKGDGRPDVYVVNDMGRDFGPNVLWENTGAGFVDASAACTCGLTMDGMGGSLGDYDADGVIDLFITTVGESTLLRGLSDGSFVDYTLSTGIDPIDHPDDMGWGSAWMDLNGDGDLDLAMAQGDHGPAYYDGGPTIAQPLRIMQQSDGQFSDVAPSLGMDALGLWRSVVPIDLNDDGVLDLVVSDLLERPRLYLSDGCTAAGWLGVQAPEGSLVYIEAGGRSQLQPVTAGIGYGASRRPEAWFGLGSADSVDRLEVVLPWGQGSLLWEEPFPARRWVRVLP